VDHDYELELIEVILPSFDLLLLDGVLENFCSVGVPAKIIDHGERGVLGL
jgi:hypothetical protein